MRKSYLASILFCLTLTGAALTAHASPATSLDAKAVVKMPEARNIALKVYPGKIVKEELEKEAGGSGLRYTFDIKSDAGTHEVGVDAKDGKILENSVEGSDKD
ncbi:PepSY domain-containing protein [Dyella tabacisoli]|uniref:Peptidase M4 n=1 Tax=Dyella tabacisoli TaxID=2282381 RepID=A0A369UJJ4_9GAMM|nr:PepSY domain-containing protein [Dyella tabacisoli]RDD80696.1 peptidase M4 [Dyella tabacisoli]